jgi:hypothetical protein
MPAYRFADVSSHEEHGTDHSSSPGQSAASRRTVSKVPSRAPSLQLVETELEFSDTNALTCLLCARAFKSHGQLKRHNKESDLHEARHFIC